MSKNMADVLGIHPEPEIDNGYWYCMCGHDYGVNFTTDSIATHQQDMLEAAGFGLVADAKAERGWLAKTRNTDGSIAIIGHFKTEAEAEKWAGKYPASFVEPS